MHEQKRGVIYVSFRVLEERRANTSIEDPKAIRRILENLGLWLANVRPIPRAHSPPDEPVPFEAFFSQLPPAHWEC